jgi:hypothetical protein
MRCGVRPTRASWVPISPACSSEVGRLAHDHDTGILLSIDDLHYVDRLTFRAFIVGLHRASQLSLPITIAGAGLPTLAALTGEAKTDAERMFAFPRIGSLTEEEAAEALQTPANSAGVRWTDDALAAALELTQCYPYFLQDLGLHAWDAADGPAEVNLDDFGSPVDRHPR